MAQETGRTEKQDAEAYLMRALDRAKRAGVKNPGVDQGVRVACQMLALYTRVQIATYWTLPQGNWLPWYIPNAKNSRYEARLRNWVDCETPNEKS